MQATEELAAALGQQGRYQELESLVEASPVISPDSKIGYATASFLVRAGGYLLSSQYEETAKIIERQVTVDQEFGDELDARIHNLRGHLVRQQSKLLALRHFGNAMKSFEGLLNHRSAIEAKANVAVCLMDVGAFDEAEVLFDEAIARADAMGLRYVTCGVLPNMMLLFTYLARFDIARSAAKTAYEMSLEQGDPRSEAIILSYLSSLELAAKNHRAAEAAALRANLVAARVASLQPFAQACLARAYLAQGRVPESLKCATTAGRLFRKRDNVEDGEGVIRLALVEALLAANRKEWARRELIEAVERLHRESAQIENPTWRLNFLRRIPEHARTVELATRELERAPLC
jgi:tetratricopeptide (TPR) repeat protein